MAFFREFKEFAIRGNVIDLAVGVIIGAAFGKIVDALVKDVLMPPLGYLIGGVDLSKMKIVLKPGDAAAKVEEVAVLYGSFLNAIFEFLIIALCIFMVVKIMNKLKRNEAEEVAVTPAAPPAPSTEEVLLTEIRDILAAKK
jgi:large conductance mechanosensitive channel